MFKGLKSKIAEETKRIQEAVVTQVGEGFNNLTNSSKRNELSETPKNSPNRSNSSSNIETPNLVDVSLPDLDGNYSRQSSVSDSFISAASSSSFMQEAADGELTPTRQRHDSVSSIGSVENFFPPLPPFSRLAPIPSDIETDVESVAGSSSFVSGASKEQISSVLTKLQGRAANYKDKYRQLLHSYKDISKENEKIRTVLTTSQDKTLRRIQELKEERKLDEKAKREMEESLRAKVLAQDGTIATLRHQVQLLKEGKPADDDVLNEVLTNHPPAAIFAEREKVKKLEDLLNRCKESIKNYKEKIQTLSGENQELKKKVQDLEQDHKGNEEISDFVTERKVDEWKLKLKQAEETWNKKIHDAAETSALNVAQIKQEMHLEIEKKDQTIEELRQLIKTAEKSAVEEEGKKREELQTNFEQNMIEKTSEFERKTKEIRDECDKKIAEIEKQFGTKLKEREEQMNLAVEERDLQKMAALSQHDERLDRLQAEIEVLKTEKMQLESTLENSKHESTQKLNESTKKLENQLKFDYETEMAQQKENFKQRFDEFERNLNEKQTLLNEITSEKTSLEQEIERLRREFDASRDEFRRILDENQNFQNRLSEKNDEIRQFNDLIEGSTNDNKEINENLKNLENTLRLKEEDLKNLKQEFSVVSKELETSTKEFQAKNLRCEFMEKELQRVLDEKRLIEADFKSRLDQLMQTKSGEVEDFRKQLEDLKNMEISTLNADLERMKNEFQHKESSLKQELQQKNDELMFCSEDLKTKNELAEKLRMELDDKTTKFNSLIESRDNLTKEIHLLNETKTNLEGSLSEQDELHRQIASLNMDLEQARTYVKNLEQEKLFVVEEKNIQIREANDVLGALEDAVDLYRKQLDAQVKENEIVQKKLSTDARFQKTEGESRLSEFRERISDLEEAVDVYKSQQVEKRTQVEEKNVEIANLREKLQNLIRDGFFYSSEKDLRIKELVEKLDEMDMAVDDYKKQNEFLKKISEDAKILSENRTNSTEIELNDVKNRLKSKENELKSLENSFNLNKSELSFIIGAFVDAIEQIYDSSMNLEILSNVKNSFESYSNFVLSLDSLSSPPADESKSIAVESLKKLLSKFVENEIHLENSDRRIKEFEKKLFSTESSSAETNSALETKISDLNSELYRMKQNSSDFESRIDELTTEIAKKEQLIEQLTTANEDDRGRLCQLEKFNEEMNSEMTQIRQDLHSKQEEINHKSHEVLALKQQITKSEEIHQKTVQESKNSSNSELKSAQKELETLRERLAQAEHAAKIANDDLEREKEKLNAEGDARVADYKKKAETKLSQIKKLLENEKDTLSQRVGELEVEIASKNEEISKIASKNDEIEKKNKEIEKNNEELEKKIAEIDRISTLNSSDSKANEDKLVAKMNDEKNLAVEKCRDEYETKIRSIIDDHNDRVKQMAKELQAEFAKKESDWQEELSSAYNKSDEDRQRVTKEYQKEMKQLYKDLQEKSSTTEEMKAGMEKEKLEALQTLREEHEKILKEKEEQFKFALKQRLEDQEKQNKLELQGLTQEWNADRRNLEQQAQVAQGDVQIESPLYLKQRVKQLESQLEGFKDKQKWEAEHGTKNSHNSDLHSKNNDRLSSVSLDYSNPVFCEPTEAEYLRNIVFRYMVERESLGKESVTLAKAIAAVLKLSLDQTKEVLAKEESRLSTW